MSLFKSILLITLFCFSSYALTGKVQNASGAALENVAISFSNNDTVIYSDVSGNFNLDLKTPIEQCLKQHIASLLSYSNGKIQLYLNQKKLIKISLFNIRGQNVFTFKKHLNKGWNTVNIKDFSAGLYVLKATIGKEQFLKRLVPGYNFDWHKKNTNSASSRSRATIDTVHLVTGGYQPFSKTISSYTESLGTITLTSMNDKWFGFQPIVVDTAFPNLVHMLFRVYDRNLNGISDLDTSKLKMYEDGLPITIESKLVVEKTTIFSDSLETVILLDNSSSLGDDLSAVKEAAKTMIRNIADNQKIAVYAFSERAVLVQDFTPDTAVLINAINDIPAGYSSTNLYGALIEALGRVENDADLEVKSIKFGNILLFTDGRDTQGSSTLQQVLAARKGKQIFSVALGSDIDTTALKQISGKIFNAENASQLEELFSEIQNQIKTANNSFFWANYASPKRGNVDHTIELRHTENINTNYDSTVTGTFNSAIFAAGWAPEARDVKITYNALRDSLIGSYVYYDKDGDIEGETQIKWIINGVESSVKGNKIKLPAYTGVSDTISFNVRPVAKFGSPDTGNWAKAIKVTGSWDFIYGDSTQYYFADIESTPDGIIISGSSKSNWNNTTNLAFFKIDVDGNMVWHKAFDGTKYEGSYNFISTSDGYIGVGLSQDTSTHKKDGLAIKVDKSGNKQLEKLYTVENDLVLWEILNCQNGFIIAGSASNLANYEDTDPYLLKINGIGDTLWSKTYDDTIASDISGIIEVDSGFIISGTSQDVVTGQNNTAWVKKVDFNGNLLWEKPVPHCGGSIVESDNGYFIIGKDMSLSTGEKPVAIDHLDKSGIPQGYFSLGIADNYYRYKSYKVGDNYLILATTSFWEGNSGFLVMVNEFGLELWVKTFDQGDILEAAAVDQDGNILVIGHKNGIARIFKLDPNGNPVKK